MIRVCPKCGVENGAAAMHCRNCRAKLPEPIADLMYPPPSSSRGSFLRSTLWVCFLLIVGATGFWAREHVDWRSVRSDTAGLCVHWQHIQSDVVGAMHRWYVKWLTTEPALMPVPAPAVTSAPVRTPPPENVVKIRCRRCGGWGCWLCGGRWRLSGNERLQFFGRVKS